MVIQISIIKYIHLGTMIVFEKQLLSSKYTNLILKRLIKNKRIEDYISHNNVPTFKSIHAFSHTFNNPWIARKGYYCYGTITEKTSIYLIKSACQQLLQIDPLLLDQMCIVFGNNYILAERNKNPSQTKANQQLTANQLKKIMKNNDCLKAFSNIKIVYEFLNGSKIGFLRGDLHTTTFFLLNKNINQKIKQTQSVQRRQEIQYEQSDFKKVFNLITDSSNFRLPKMGIYNRALESKANLSQRQLLLEQVSNQQSHDKFEIIIESLLKLNKIQQAQVVRKFIIEWLVPITSAIKEEQSKCASKDLKTNRKIYADFIVKMDAEKIATIALTQLIIQTFQSIYKQGSINQFEIQQYEGINQKNYISKMIQKIQAQMYYQREQRIFKDNQRQYDQLLNLERKRKKKASSLHIQPQIQEENMDIQQPQPTKSNKNGEQAQQKQRLRYWKSQAFKQKQKNLQFKYVNPQQRKEFLSNMMIRMGKFRGYNTEMPQKVQAQLGNLIVYLLKQLLKVPNKYGYKVPLLMSQHKTIKKGEQITSISILRLNQYFLSTLIPKLEKSQDMFMHMERSVPTIIEPLPWISPEIGGYYSQATNVMRYSDCPVQERLMKYADNHRVFGVLNFLSTIPWKINRKVLQLVEQIWREGGQQNYIPKRYSEMLNPYLTSYKLETDHKAKKQLAKKIQNLRQQHSLRCYFLLLLNIARSFEKIDYFFFPHNLDFRGRVYPVPPHLNHIGSDLSRGLLIFGIGKRLGKSGLRWLKIHTANLMGKDKAPIDDKLIFIEENLQKIKKMAKNPLGERQWLAYQDSWQAIASILDLSAALQCDNPQQYISHLHIHQDGSCNGLQHYAALGRDIQGAYQVNLGPREKPSDIYTHVANMVIEMINQDISKQQNPELIELARKLPDNIKRKTIKQTVMTSVYGVTFVGARQQIYKQLRDQNFLSEDQTYQASLYIAKLTLKAISNLFTGAHEIKKWFRNCAHLVSKTGNPVGWISPLGLPIVQPYRKQAKVDIIRTISHRMQVPKQIQNIPINVMKQTSAFPPNYVHSLDSSHMMYTAEVSQQRGLTFAAVHDSYWTHAATVDQMNIVLRQQFIKLHSQPLLQNFKKSLQNRFPEIEFPPIPQRGEFNLQKIKESLYFFS